MVNQVLNITGVDRSIPLLPSAARTATPDTFELTETGRYTALVVVLDVTAVVSTPSVTVAVVGVDRASGKTWPLVTSAAVAATGTTVLKVSPGITPVTNVAVADILPPTIRVVVTHGNANSITYTVAAHVTN